MVDWSEAQPCLRSKPVLLRTRGKTVDAGTERDLPSEIKWRRKTLKNEWMRKRKGSRFSPILYLWLSYSLKCICNLTMNTGGSSEVTYRHVHGQSGRIVESPNTHAPSRGRFSPHAANKCPRCGLFSGTFFIFLYHLSVGDCSLQCPSSAALRCCLVFIGTKMC